MTEHGSAARTSRNDFIDLGTTCPKPDARRVENRHRRFGFARVALALLLVASVASAEPTAAERETARTLLLSGRDKKKAGKLKEALSDFERANGIMHVPTTALDLGKAQEALGLLVEARASYLEAARFPASSDESRAFKNASKEAKQLADAVAPRLATLTVNAPSGAKVRVDDAELSASSVGAALKVNPGKHEIAGALGADEKRLSIEVGEGDAKAVTLQLAAPIERTPDPQDDKSADNAPPKTEKKTNPLVWVGGTIGVIGVGVGAVTGVMSLTLRNNLVQTCANGTDCPPSTYADLDRGTTLGAVSTVGFVVGGAGLALMIYGLLSPKQVAVQATPSAQSSLRIVPTPTGFAGVF